MKAKEIPTSPKNNPKRQKLEKSAKEVDNYLAGGANAWQKIDKPKEKSHVVFISIVLSLVFGFLAGWVASFSSDYIFSKIPFLATLVYKNNNQNQIVIKSGDKLKDVNARVASLVDNYQGSVVGVYEKLVSSSDLAQSLYQDSDRVASALVVTSDGYLVLPEGVVEAKEDFVVIDKEGQIYDIVGHWLDSASNISILKINGNNFPSVNFISHNDPTSAEEVLCLVNYLNGSGAFSLNNLQGQDHETFFRSADALSSRYLLAGDIVDDFLGGAVFDFDGKVVGLILEKGEAGQKYIFPGDLIKATVDNLLKNGEIKRVSLGLTYFNLDEAVGVVDDLSQGLKKGALVYKDGGGNAVEANSAASRAGVLAGDIIVKVNDLELDKTNDLATVIQKFSSADKITLTLNRKGLEKTVEVEF